MDKDLYETPSKTLDTESETKYDDNPNAPEISEDDLENKSEVKELLNNPENDTVLDLHKFLNTPDILDLKTGQDTSNSDSEQSEMREYPPSCSRQREPRPHSPTGILGSSWRYTPQDPHPPLREVRLPQLYEPPSAEGCCIPRLASPPRQWAGFDLEEELMKFLETNIL